MCTYKARISNASTMSCIRSSRVCCAFQIAFDFQHLRLCFGNNSVLTTDEYASRYGHPIQIGRIVCWHAPGPTCPVHFTSLYHNCPARRIGSTSSRAATSSLPGGRIIAGSADRGYLLQEDMLPQLTVKPPKDKILYVACLPAACPLEYVISAYAGVPDDVLVAGDLHNVGLHDWPEYKASLDLPFAREPACPDALVIQPAEGIFLAASAAQEEMFGQEPYVCVHWRRGDFKEWCAMNQPGSCYFPPKQVRASRGASHPCNAEQRSALRWGCSAVIAAFLSHAEDSRGS